VWAFRVARGWGVVVFPQDVSQMNRYAGDSLDTTCCVFGSSRMAACLVTTTRVQKSVIRFSSFSCSKSPIKLIYALRRAEARPLGMPKPPAFSPPVILLVEPARPSAHPLFSIRKEAFHEPRHTP